MHTDQPQLLAHAQPAVAGEIRTVMHAAYAIEAALLGADDFAPLRRTAEQIAASTGRFVGLRRAGQLVALAELEHDDHGGANIAALVTLPKFFRQGLATRLLQSIVASSGTNALTVSTGSANAPALQLYQRFGFAVTRRWTTACGIPMVTLTRATA